MSALANEFHPVDRGRRPKEAAQIFGISTPTLWRWIASGKLKARKLSPRVTVILDSDIQALLTSAGPK